MGTGLVIRARLRTGWRALLGLVLLGGLGLGLTLACLAGARRTQTAFTRFVDEYQPGDFDISIDDDSVPIDERLRQLDAVEHLPQVAHAAAGAYVFHLLDGRPDRL